MSSEPRELFAFIKPLHSVHIYFLLMSQAPTVSDEWNDLRIQNIFVIDRFLFFPGPCVLCVVEYYARCHEMSNFGNALRVIHTDCIVGVEQI